MASGFLPGPLNSIRFWGVPNSTMYEILDIKLSILKKGKGLEGQDLKFRVLDVWAQG